MVQERLASAHDRSGRGSGVWRVRRYGGGDGGVGRRAGRGRVGQRSRRGARREVCPLRGRRCRRMRRCERRIGYRVRRGGWYWLGRWGQRCVGLGVIEHGADAVPEVGKPCSGIRDARFGRHDLIDMLDERGHQQLQGLGIAVLDGGVENRTGFGAELGECLRGEGRVGPVETCGTARGCGTAVTASEQAREQGRQGQWGRESGAWPTPSMHPAGCRGCFRVLRGGAVTAGLRHRRPPPGAGEDDAADNGAAHCAAEPADEARTNPLGGLGSKAGGGERGRHGRESSRYIICFQGEYA